MLLLDPEEGATRRDVLSRHRADDGSQSKAGLEDARQTLG
jgi:hypothetical protein